MNPASQHPLEVPTHPSTVPPDPGVGVDIVMSAFPLSSPLSSRNKPHFPEASQILRISPLRVNSTFNSCLRADV